MDENRCFHCRFYRGNKMTGDCHRFPPNPTHPKVASDDWCGEWVLLTMGRRYDVPGASLVDRVTRLTHEVG